MTESKRVKMQSPVVRSLLAPDDTLDGFLEEKYGDLRAAVEKAIRTWSDDIHRFLREETGLSLASSAVAAPMVSVVGGLPEPFLEIVARSRYPELWELFLHRASLGEAVKALGLLIERHSSVKRWATDDSGHTASRDALEVARSAVRNIIQALGSDSLLAELQQPNEDLLGTYEASTGTIRVFWLAVGLHAGALRPSIEALAVVTLTHELAHAYTHMGRDVDGRTWNTGAFRDSDREIKEGLAQFYTSVVCHKRLSKRLPEVSLAFDRLLASQSALYHTHETWAQPVGKSGEAVRNAMLRARLKNVTRYSQFRSELADSSRRLTRTTAPKPSHHWPELDPREETPPGVVHCVGTDESGTAVLCRLQATLHPGSGRVRHLAGMGERTTAAAGRAVTYLHSIRARIKVAERLSTIDIAVDVPAAAPAPAEYGSSVAFFVAILCALANRRLEPGTVVLGDATSDGQLVPISDLDACLDLVEVLGVTRCLLPTHAKTEVKQRRPQGGSATRYEFYEDIEQAVIKALQPW